MAPEDGSSNGGVRGRLGTLAAAFGGRLANFRYLLEDGLYALSRVPVWVFRRLRGLGRRLRAAWQALDLYTQRRLAAAAAAAAGFALIWFVVIPVAPCQLPGGDRCPPGDDAEHLVPAAALAYLHVNLDGETEQANRAAELAEELPTLSGELRRLASAVPGLGLELGEWFGGEVATALLRGGEGQGRQVVLLEAADGDGARRFARELAGGNASSEEHRGVEIETGDGQATALTGGFLAVGEPSAVRSVIDVVAGEDEALADADAGDVRERLPEARLGDAYVSGAGARRLLRPRAGALALLEPFVNPAAARAAAAAVELTEDGIELTVVSEQEEGRAQDSPGFFAAFERYEPELPERLAPGTLAYVGLGRPAEGARDLISGAASGAPAIAGAIEALARDLQRQGQISLVDQVLPLLGEEAAIAIGPPGRASSGAIPYLALVTRGIDEEQASSDMARLQGPIARAAGAGGGAFEEVEVDGETALALRVSPTVQLTYSVFDDLLVLATQPEAVEDARADDGLAGSDAFGAATSDLGGEPVALAFADLEGLIGLGERAGLAEDPAYAVFAADLRRLGAAGLLVGSDDGVLTTRLRLLVG